MNLHHALRLLGAAGTVGVLAWSLWHYAGRPLALVVVHFGTRRPTTVNEPPNNIPAFVNSTVDNPAEHVGVTEEIGLDGYVAIALDLDEQPAGLLLCDRPLCPPPGTDAWWAVRFGRARQLDTLRAAVIGRTLPPHLRDLFELEVRRLAAQDELFHHLTETVFEATAEHQLVGAGR